MLKNISGKKKNFKKNDWINDLIDFQNLAAVETHDPEDFIDENHSLESFSDSSDIYTGREHYLTVEKSKIRNDGIVLEDKKYFGKKTNLKDLYKDNYDTLENKINKYKDFYDDEILSSLSMDDDEKYSNIDFDRFSGDSVDDVDDNAEKKRSEELKFFIQNEQKDLIQEITKTNQIEIEKGKHIQAQLKIYDCLLDARIRLQKALVAVNSLTINHRITELNENKTFIENAENESILLIDFLTDIRKTLIEAEKINIDGPCLKQENYLNDHSIDFFYNDISNLDKQILTWQNEILLKWSDKVKTASTFSLNKFNSFYQNVLDLIQENMKNKEKFLKKTHVDKSEKKEPKNKERFDDTDFYQTLLLDLIDRRMVDSGNTRGIRWSILKQKKQKNNIDTKASKGRRLRYHVHDKLQNFMAPNSISLWNDEQIEYFYFLIYTN
ncbi:hypothetical protein PMAC_000675 [Pneumocystis sp. 'macacae']|nr:hypothetical protein PMAC_000675 [Pneumocystis sp. 'macacae']